MSNAPFFLVWSLYCWNNADATLHVHSLTSGYNTQSDSNRPLDAITLLQVVCLELHSEKNHKDQCNYLFYRFLFNFVKQLKEWAWKVQKITSYNFKIFTNSVCLLSYFLVYNKLPSCVVPYWKGTVLTFHFKWSFCWSQPDKKDVNYTCKFWNKKIFSSWRILYFLAVKQVI